jgi:hypothetical protein
MLEVTFKLSFDDIEELEEDIFKLADMNCFLKGYEQCLADNDEYHNPLLQVSQNSGFISKITCGLKTELDKLKGE